MNPATRRRGARMQRLREMLRRFSPHRRAAALHLLQASREQRPSCAARQRGVIYLALLLVIAALGVGLAATGTFWHEVRLREKEQELLFVGLQYRRAIQQYYETFPGVKKYPPTLEALLLDERSPDIRRYLRRPFRDPLTGSTEWGIVDAPQGGVMGVYSLAPGAPVKQANFPQILNWPDGQGSYADWKFAYVPQQGVVAVPPAPAEPPGFVR